MSDGDGMVEGKRVAELSVVLSDEAARSMSGMKSIMVWVRVPDGDGYLVFKGEVVPSESGADAPLGKLGPLRAFCSQAARWKPVSLEQEFVSVPGLEPGLFPDSAEVMGPIIEPNERGLAISRMLRAHDAYEAAVKHEAESWRVTRESRENLSVRRDELREAQDSLIAVIVKTRAP